MDANGITLFFNSTTTVLDSYGVDSIGSYRIVGFSIASILVGYISLLILSLDKKQGEFSKYPAYEKIILSYFIGGLALSSVILILSLILIFVHPTRLEPTALGSIFIASLFSSILLDRVSNSKNKTMSIKSITKYFVANFLIMVAVAYIVGLMALAALNFAIISNSHNLLLKMGFVVFSLAVVIFSGRLALNVKGCIKAINDEIETFFAKKGNIAKSSSKR